MFLAIHRLTLVMTAPSKALLLERKLDLVLVKATMKLSHFQPLPNNRLRSVLKAKLWRMGKAIARQNSRQRKVVIKRWQKSTWDLSFKPTEIHSQVELKP